MKKKLNFNLNYNTIHYIIMFTFSFLLRNWLKSSGLLKARNPGPTPNFWFGEEPKKLHF